MRERRRREGTTRRVKNTGALRAGNNPAPADLHRPFRGRQRMRKMDWRAVDLSRGRACEAPRGIRSHYRVREDPAWLYLSFRPQVRRRTEFKVDEGEVSVTAWLCAPRSSFPLPLFFPPRAAWSHLPFHLKASARLCSRLSQTPSPKHNGSFQLEQRRVGLDIGMPVCLLLACCYTGY